MLPGNSHSSARDGSKAAENSEATAKPHASLWTSLQGLATHHGEASRTEPSLAARSQNPTMLVLSSPAVPRGDHEGAGWSRAVGSHGKHI